MEAADEAVISIDLIQKRLRLIIISASLISWGKTRQADRLSAPDCHVSCRAERKLTPKIGKEFGGKDHTTVLHAIDKIEKQLAEDDNLQDDIRNLRMELQP